MLLYPQLLYSHASRVLPLPAKRNSDSPGWEFEAPKTAVRVRLPAVPRSFRHYSIDSQNAVPAPAFWHCAMFAQPCHCDSTENIFSMWENDCACHENRLSSSTNCCAWPEKPTRKSRHAAKVLHLPPNTHTLRLRTSQNATKPCYLRWNRPPADDVVAFCERRPRLRLPRKMLQLYYQVLQSASPSSYVW